MICPKCNEILEEHDFDRNIGVCPKCNSHFTNKEYNDILKSTEKRGGM